MNEALQCTIGCIFGGASMAIVIVMAELVVHLEWWLEKERERKSQ